MEPSFYPEDLVVGKARNGKVRYGVIDQTPDMESDDMDSDYDFEDWDLPKGFVRLSWYPEGKHEKVDESKLQLVDRSALPCDVVREKNGKQLGTVVQVEVTCNGMIVGTSKTISNIAAKTLKFINPFMEGDLVAFGPWLGRVMRVYSGVIVVFPNGAKGQIPLDSRGSELLEDQFPHITNEGSFYDGDCAYYPGQVLTGTAKAFRDIIWNDEKKTVQLKPKSRYKVVVEQVSLFAVKVLWRQRSFTDSDSKSELQYLNSSGVTSKKSSSGSKSADGNTPDAIVNFKDLDVDVKLDWESKMINLKFVQGLPPPAVIAGRMLKNVKRLMHFWTGNVHMGERYQYKLTAEDVAQLSQQGKLMHPKKRTRRNIASRRANRKRMSNTKSGDRSSKNPKKLNDESSQNSTQESDYEEDSNVMKESGDAKENVTDIPDATARPEPTHSNAENREKKQEHPDVNTVVADDENEKDDSKDIDGLLRVWISHKDLEPMNKYLGSKASQISEFNFNFTNPEYALRQAFRDCSPIEVLKAFKNHSLKSIPSTRQVGHKMTYKVGQYVTVDICSTSTMLEVEWQDGTIAKSLPSKDITQAHHIDQNDFCPGDFVCDERTSNDIYLYGVVLKADSANRMVEIQWFSLDPNHNEVTALEKEEMSAYEVSDHPDYNFRISDILVRLSPPSEQENTSSCVGELLRVMPDGKLHVLWSDGSLSDVHPHELMRVGGDEDEEVFWNAEDQSDDSSDSDSSGWEMEDSEGRAESEEATVSPKPRDSPVIKKDETSTEQSSGTAPYWAVTAREEEREKAREAERRALDEENEEVEEPTPIISKESSASAIVDFPRFSSDPTAPATHHYRRKTFVASDQKSFLRALKRDIKLFRKDLPDGIYVKTFEDRMDLLSVLFLGPENTPYEDGVFAFDVQLPGDYPTAPPLFHYISYSHRLNPNLYEDGKVCVSLLGTWMGKGNETWTGDSNLIQVLISIQGLILNSEPYYNEAGYEGHRGTVEGQSNSRCYNEMVILRLVEHTSAVLFSSPRPFQELCKAVCPTFAAKLISRVEALLAQSDDESKAVNLNLAYPLLPLSKGLLISLKQKLGHLVNTLANLKEGGSS